MPIRLVNVYFLNVPSVSSPYFNKIKRTSHLGKLHALCLEILTYLATVETCSILVFFYQAQFMVFETNLLDIL